MWIVRLALRRPYTFIVLGLLILILGPLAIVRTPTDGLSLGCSSPGSARTFFPSVDSGRFTLHLRARTGTRIEETARLCDLVEGFIREHRAQRAADGGGDIEAAAGGDGVAGEGVGGRLGGGR